MALGVPILKHYRVDPAEVAHNDLLHQDLHYLPSSFWILNIVKLGQNFFFNFGDINFIACFLVLKGLSVNTMSCVSTGNKDELENQARLQQAMLRRQELLDRIRVSGF